VLAALGGWAEWCICEDAELGLRIFEAGYQALYLPRSYGRGLMPDSFVDYKKQRFRWAYGAMQILRYHARALLRPAAARSPPASATTSSPAGCPGFRRPEPAVQPGGHRLVGGDDAAAHAHRSAAADVLGAALSLFTFKLVKLVHLYTHRVGVGLRQTLAAAIAGLALSHTIGRAVLKGLVTRSEPFFRTPKRAGRHALLLASRAPGKRRR